MSTGMHRPEILIGAVVLLAALVGCYSSRSTAQVKPRPHAPGAERDQQAAEIAMFVLRATVPGGEVPRWVSIAPSVDHVSPHAAARVLVALKKPVECDAIVDQMVLNVSCRLLSDTTLLDWQRRSVAWQGASIDSVLLERCSENVENATLLLRAEVTEDTMSVPLEAFTAWLQGFYQQFTLGSNETADPPPGTCAVLDILPPQRIRVIKK